MSGDEEVVVVEIDFVAAPAEVVAEMFRERALHCDVGGKIADGDVVGGDLLERAVDIGIGGIEEIVVV